MKQYCEIASFRKRRSFAAFVIISVGAVAYPAIISERAFAQDMVEHFRAAIPAASCEIG